MKYSLFPVMLLLILWVTPVRAQTECADIEWVRFSPYNQFYSRFIENVDSNENQLVIGSYIGSPTWGNYNFPGTNPLMPNYYIGWADSNGNPSWVRTASMFVYGYGTEVSGIMVANQNIYATIIFKWKTEFAGVTYENTSNGQSYNTLLVKMNQQGQVLMAHQFNDLKFSLVYVDSNSNYYCYLALTGSATIGGQTFNTNGNTDVLLFKLNNQAQLQWAQQIGGSRYDYLASCVADAQDNLYITGDFESPSLNLGGFLLNNPGVDSTNIFVAKLSQTGQFLWAKNIQSPTPNTICHVSKLALDNDNNVYINGSVKGSFLMDTTTVASSPIEKYNTFLLKYDQNSNHFSALTFNEGENHAGYLLFLPDRNELVTTGSISNYDTVNFQTSTIIGNNTDFYVTGISTTGEKLAPKWALHSSGSGSEFIPILAADPNDHLYLSSIYSVVNGEGIFGNYTFPNIPTPTIGATSNFYNAKLGFLSREVTIEPNGSLTAVQDSAIYQWMDCDHGSQPIPGATQRTYPPQQAGSYAVQVSNSFCSVTSDCITTTAINKNQWISRIEVYPNPIRDLLWLNQIPKGTQITVFDVLGRPIYAGTASDTHLTIPTQNWIPGIYLIRLNKDGAFNLKKIVKK